jgi:copper(I)-binding protein
MIFIAFAITVASLTLAPRHVDATVVIHDAWVRESTATRTSSAAYMRIDNRSGRAVALVQVTVPGVETAQVHASVDRQGRTAMEPIARLTIPAGASVDLAPGGTHVMLTGIARPLVTGASIGMRLTFDDGHTRTVRAIVRPLSAMGPR